MELTGRQLAVVDGYMRMRGYEADAAWECKWFDRVYVGGDAVAFAKLGLGMEDKPMPTRREFEADAIAYLMANDACDRAVRADAIDLHVVAEGRALLRHHIDVHLDATA